MSEDKIEPSIYRYILKHTKKNQIFLLILTALSMPFVYVSLEVPKIIINSALGGQNIPNDIFSYPIDQIRYLMILCGLFLVLVLINGGLKYIINVYRGILGERMLRRFRFDLYSRLLRFNVSHFKNVSQGEIIPMITAETEPLGGFIGDAFSLPAFQGGLLITYLAFIFNQDVFLGLAAVILYPPQLYIIPKLQRQVNRLAKSRVQAMRKFSDKVGESVSAISDIHVNDTANYEKAHASNRLSTIYSIRYAIYKKKFFIKFLNNFLAQLTPFFFYAIGGYFVIKGELSLGALVAVLAAYKDLASPWKELLKYYQITEDIRVKYKQIINQFQVSSKQLTYDKDKSEEQSKFLQSPIRFVSVNYSEDDYVKSVDNVSFDIGKAEHLAILGLGGSGRSVIAQLLANLIQPTQGKIRLGQHDFAELTESYLGENLAYVSGQSYVFQGTVKENLLYGLKSKAVKQRQYEGQALVERKNYIENAMQAANATDDIDAEWINTEITGFTEVNDFDKHIYKILELTDFYDDLYQMGMYSRVINFDHPKLSQFILNARKSLQQTLEKSQYNHLVEQLDEHSYQVNLSLAENLLYGMPANQDMDLQDVLTSPEVVEVLNETHLTEPLFKIGIKVAKITLELFADVPEDSPLFERFSFIHVDDLEDFSRLAKLDENVQMNSIGLEDRKKIMQLPFKLTVAKHRLGLITKQIQEKAIQAHILLKQRLGENNHLIEFYDREKIAEHLSLQDNILFGRLVYGQNNANQKVRKLIHGLIDELNMSDLVVEVGLANSVGVSGAKLSAAQRQKLTIARALIKNPKLLIVNEATAILDTKLESKLIKNMVEFMQSKTLVWVLNDLKYINHFDKYLVLENGKVIEFGEVGELNEKPEILRMFK